MRRLLLTAVLIVSLLSLYAQSSPREEILANPNLSASNSVAYPGPKTRSYTPAPYGKKPFYLSHYGRHGSRYLTKPEDYDYLPNVMGIAEEKGMLTPFGKDVLRRVRIMKEMTRNRLGDLTELGKQQNRDIALRMTENFPELFKGNAQIKLRSTLVPRCVMSMMSAVQELTAINPKLRIDFDASFSDMYYLYFVDEALREHIKSDTLKVAYDTFCKRHWKEYRLSASLFNDTAYINKEIDIHRVNYYLYRLAGSIQNTDLRDEMTLYDVFTSDEIYENWLTGNAYWFTGFGFTPLNGNMQPFAQRNLLRNIVLQADTAIMNDKPSVFLRYGHDTIILPLVCLINVNGYGTPYSDFEKLVDGGWIDYRVFPMAANLQLIFYRKNAKDKDVLVKILLNENEATLPIKSEVAPYYHWNDVRSYFMEILSSYKEGEKLN